MQPDTIYQAPPRQRRKPRRRDQRDPKGGIRLTERDIALFIALLDNGVMLLTHLAPLFFGSVSTARIRLRKLFDHGYIFTRYSSTHGGMQNAPAIYGLDWLGVVELRKRGVSEAERWHRSNKNITDFFIEHRLAIVDFRVAVILACKRLGLGLSTWLMEQKLKASYDRVELPNGEKVPVIPDSFFTIETPQRPFSFALEMDRGTMSLGRMQKEKFTAYTEYFKSGGYTNRFGTKSLRVLTVVPSERRLANLKAAAEQVGAKSMYWFAVADTLTPEAILTNESVWQVAGRSGDHQLLDHLEIAE
jgi:hypothetical protein